MGPKVFEGSHEDPIMRDAGEITVSKAGQQGFDSVGTFELWWLQARILRQATGSLSP